MAGATVTSVRGLRASVYSSTNRSQRRVCSREARRRWGVSRDFRTFGLSGAGTGLRGDGSSHLLVLQQLDVQIAFGLPSNAGDIAQPGRGEIER